MNQTQGLAVPFPMRSDFLAEIIVPVNMTTAEAERFCKFILTLATDYKP